VGRHKDSESSYGIREETIDTYISNYMGERRAAYRVLVGKPEGKRTLENPGVNGRIILKYVLEKYGREEWIGSMWLRIGTDDGLLCMW
jgi:hypothetical protein